MPQSHDAPVPTDVPTAAPTTIEWKPSRRSAVAMNVAGLLVAVAGLLGYGWVAVARYGSGSFAFGGWEAVVGMLGTLAAVVVLLVVHEALHGLAMLAYGARPSFGVGVGGQGWLPYAYATAAGHRFARPAYTIVALAPTVVVTAVTVAAVWLAPYGGWLVVPAALHLGGCVGDWWLVGVAARQPAGSAFEDLKDGLRVHLP